MRYCDLAADLLNESADFFIRISEGRADVEGAMAGNAGTYRHMADLIRNDPAGSVEHLTHAEMTARLLEDAAQFFESVGQVNAMILDQMQQNADVFRQVAKQVRVNPEQSAAAV